MPKKKPKLTSASIASLPPGEYVDGLCPTLNLAIGARRKTWSVRTRLGDHQRRVRLGFYPQLGLAAARAAARAIAERVESGLPPSPSPVHPRTAAISVGDLIAKYERYRIARGGRGTKSLVESMKHVRRCLGPSYLAMPAASFDKHALRAVRDRVAMRGPVSSNRFLSAFKPITKWASREDLVEVDISPSVIPVGHERPRERVLTDPEIASVWRACDALGSTPEAVSYGRLVKFLLLIGCRRGEAVGLRFGAILDGVWRQAAADNKSARPHVVPLPSLAMAIVGTGDARAFVFPGATGARLWGFSKWKRALDEASNVRDWVVHDLRRSAASGWQNSGADFLVIESLLNHSPGGAAGVYMRGQMERQKAEVLTAWAAKIEHLAGGRRAVS